MRIGLTFMCSLLEKIEQETWRETGISYVTSVTRLVERLLDYRYVKIKCSIEIITFQISIKPFLCLGTV